MYVLVYLHVNACLHSTCMPVGMCLLAHRELVYACACIDVQINACLLTHMHVMLLSSCAFICTYLVVAFSYDRAQMGVADLLRSKWSCLGEWSGGVGEVILTVDLATGGCLDSRWPHSS